MAHTPVMLSEVLDYLAPARDEVYVDGTFGAGGYTESFLGKSDCRVIAVDRDPSALPRAQKLQEKYGDRLIFLHGCFGDVETLLENSGFEKVDGFVLDLGVSSMQLDQAERGFSFRFDGALDMRMDQAGGGETAADVVNTYSERELADIIYIYGEERQSRKIAKKIVERRAAQPFKTTLDLADLVRSCLPKPKRDESDPATRTFQALRIKVNDELGELERALEASEKILRPGGRIVVVTFHSLEDRMVKEFFRKKSGGDPGGSRHLPEVSKAPPVFKLLTKKAIAPGDGETKANPRARSAKLRAAVKLEAA